MKDSKKNFPIPFFNRKIRFGLTKQVTDNSNSTKTYFIQVVKIKKHLLSIRTLGFAIIRKDDNSVIATINRKQILIEK